MRALISILALILTLSACTPGAVPSRTASSSTPSGVTPVRFTSPTASDVLRGRQFLENITQNAGLSRISCDVWEFTVQSLEDYCFVMGIDSREGERYERHLRLTRNLIGAGAAIVRAEYIGAIIRTYEPILIGQEWQWHPASQSWSSEWLVNNVLVSLHLFRDHGELVARLYAAKGIQ